MTMQELKAELLDATNCQKCYRKNTKTWKMYQELIDHWKMEIEKMKEKRRDVGF